MAGRMKGKKLGYRRKRGTRSGNAEAVRNVILLSLPWNATWGSQCPAVTEAELK